MVSMVDVARKRMRREHRCWCALVRVLSMVLAVFPASCGHDIGRLASASGATMVVTAR